MRILVVDDEVRLAEALARGLRADGFDVDVVHDGLDAIWRATEADYAAIVLDIMLPGRNGYQVCAEIRAQGVTSAILMLTAKDGEFDEAEGLDIGADDYLRKPFSYPVLLARLRALVRRNTHGDANSTDRTLSVGDLVLDPSRLEATRTDRTSSGTTVELTPREFALLEFLVRRSPDVVSRSALLDTVWGLDFDGDVNVVEVYVGYLRKKLGRDVVHTVRGAGYRLGGASTPS